jgi:uncharacterized protein YkwD
MFQKCALLCSFLAAILGFPHFASAATLAKPADKALQVQALDLINGDRKSAGVAPLRVGRNLSRVALAHSLDMADHDYFAHNSLDGASPFVRIEKAGLHFTRAGENIGMDEGTRPFAMLHTLEQLMMHSPEHRANLLSTAYRHVGIGIAILGNRLYITEDFKN